MANKPLQSIKFPGLADTYTVPQIDDTLTQAGQAADAKKVGDKITGLKEDLNIVNGLTLTIVENTFVSKVDGVIGSSSSYVSCDYVPVSGSVWLYSITDDSNAGYAFYDESLAAVSYGAIYPIRLTWTELTVPEGAKYFRASCNKSRQSDFKIKIPVTDNLSTLMGNDQNDTLDGINYDSGYIINNTGVIGTVVASADYVHKIVPVRPNEVYYIRGTGATSARLWSLHDATGAATRVADANKSSTQKWIKLTVAETERYLVFNTATAATNYGIKAGRAARSTFNTRDFVRETINGIKTVNTAISALDNTIDTMALSFRNNMQTEGTHNLPNCTISSGNYGESGASYHFSDIPTAKMHLYFEFQQTAAIPNANVQGSVSSKRLISAFGNSYFILQYAGSVFSRNELYQQSILQLVSSSSVTLPLSVPVKYARIQGKDAFSVKYTGAVSLSSVGTVVFTDSACTINIDGITTTIDCTASTTLTDLVDAINAVSGIEAKELIVSGKTYGDLLPVVSKMTATSSTVDLIYSGALRDSTEYYDAAEIYIPLAVDESWHSVEMVFDPDGIVTAALDGVTVSKSYSGAINNNTVVLNHNNAPFKIRNLVVDYNTQGDAEVIDNQASSSYTPAKQLISDHNPHLLIFEGHGVDVCAEADAPITDNMACSTERLRILFDAARAKGYVPVTWEQVINWKLNGGTLPKRCFTIMFDDWRFSNFIDYEKRNPFVDYNVKAGLAVITNDTALTDTVTINDLSYTGEQCVNIVKTAGWFPCSHTHTHRLLTASKPSETDALLKNDVIGADRYGIYSNILVYPQGEYGEQYKGCMKHSDFALGVTIVADNYNCRGTDNYFLSRVELGTRTSLESVLSLLV